MVLHECRQEENDLNIAANEIILVSQSCDICHIEMEKFELVLRIHKEQEHKDKSNIATENKMITLNEQIDQIELDSQLGIITPEIAEFELTV